MFNPKQFFEDRLYEIKNGVYYSRKDIIDILNNNQKYIKEIVLLSLYLNIYLHRSAYICWCCIAYNMGYFGYNYEGLSKYCFVICPVSEYCKAKCLTHKERIKLARRIITKQLKYPDIENWLL